MLKKRTSLWSYGNNTSAVSRETYHNKVNKEKAQVDIVGGLDVTGEWMGEC